MAVGAVKAIGMRFCSVDIIDVKDEGLMAACRKLMDYDSNELKMWVLGDGGERRCHDGLSAGVRERTQGW